MKFFWGALQTEKIVVVEMQEKRNNNSETSTSWLTEASVQSSSPYPYFGEHHHMPMTLSLIMPGFFRRFDHPLLDSGAR